MLKIWGLLIKGRKVTNYQSWRSQEKVCLPAPATLEPISPHWRSTGVKSFSKFDGWLICSPLTYRPQIFSIKRSKPFSNVHRSSRGRRHFKGLFCLLKMTSVCFKNGQIVGLFCSSLYIFVIFLV